jgi:hypothetical protein
MGAAVTSLAVLIVLGIMPATTSALMHLPDADPQGRTTLWVHW